MRIYPSHDQWLDLNDLLAALHAQNRIPQGCTEQVLIAWRQASNAALHPLVFLAEQQLCDPSRAGKTLDIETLTAWLADHVEQPYLRLDPLKIDAATVTGLMSFAFCPTPRNPGGGCR